MQQPGLTMMGAANPQVENAILSNSGMKSVIAMQIRCTAEGMVAKETYAFASESLDNKMKCAHAIARIAVRYAVFEIMEQLILDLLHMGVNEETLDGHLSINFSYNNAVDKDCRRVLTTISFTSPITASFKNK